MDIDHLQKYLRQGGQPGTTQYNSYAQQLLSDSEAWVQQGNNASQFPQFTSWVADAQTNGNNMSPDNPFLSIMTGVDPSAGLSTLSTALG